VQILHDKVLDMRGTAAEASNIIFHMRCGPDCAIMTYEVFDHNLTLSWLPPLGRLTGLSEGVLTAELPALLGPATADPELE